MSSRAVVAGALAAALGASCVSRDTVATVAKTDTAKLCADGGWPALGDGQCPARIASRVFRHALCGCAMLTLNPSLVVDGFDARLGLWGPDAGTGDVGANAGLSFANALEVRGDLSVTGGDLNGGSRLTVDGDLALAGGLGTTSSVVSVGGSARIGGGVGVGALTVGGTLTRPAGASTFGPGSVDAGALETAAVQVDPVCPCDASDGGVDVRAIIDSHRGDNVSLSGGLPPTAFAHMASDATLEVSCGQRIFLERVGAVGEATLTLHVVGSGIVVIGDLAAPLAFKLEPGAELDLFTAGQVRFADAEVGERARPSALRWYAVGSGNIELGAVQHLSALLYAPEAIVTSGVATEVWGSLVVANLLGGWGNATALHFDRAAIALHEGCPE